MAPTGTIADRIAAAGASLTPTERRVAEVVTAEPTALAFDTVAELADRVGSSGPTVVRFAAKLGFDGYARPPAARPSSTDRAVVARRPQPIRRRDATAATSAGEPLRRCVARRRADRRRARRRDRADDRTRSRVTCGSSLPRRRRRWPSSSWPTCDCSARTSTTSPDRMRPSPPNSSMRPTAMSSSRSTQSATNRPSSGSPDSSSTAVRRSSRSPTGRPRRSPRSPTCAATSACRRSARSTARSPSIVVAELVTAAVARAARTRRHPPARGGGVRVVRLRRLHRFSPEQEPRLR